MFVYHYSATEEIQQSSYSYSQSPSLKKQTKKEKQFCKNLPIRSVIVKIYGLYISCSVCRKVWQSASPQKDETWRLHIKTYSLHGQLLLDTEQEYVIGRNELPMCIEMNISEWHRGTKVKIVAPWYAAYGMMGTEDVPAYENVLLEISIW